MDLKIPSGPAQWTALLTTIAAVSGAIAAGLVTMAGGLPDAVPASVGAALAIGGGVIGAASAGLYIIARKITADLHRDPPASLIATPLPSGAEEELPPPDDAMLDFQAAGAP